MAIAPNMGEYIKSMPKSDGIIVDISRYAADNNITEEKSKRRLVDIVETINNDYKSIYGYELFHIGEVINS